MIRSSSRNNVINKAHPIQVHPLEARRLLSTVVLDNGLLAVAGDETADELALSVAGAQIVVSEDGDLLGSFDMNDVARVFVSGGGGNDLLTNDMPLLGNFHGFVTLLGGAGNDTLVSGFGYDNLWGAEGDDRLQSEGGVKIMFGGPGHDTLLGGAARDALFGQEDDDVLSGGAGGDFLGGAEGADDLDGDAGDDTLDGGLGADSMTGGEGTDLVSYLLRLEDLEIALGQSGNGADGGAEGDTIDADIENVLGGLGSDLITGTDERNVLLGTAGSDTILGQGGKDILLGGIGSDHLDGGNDWDWLIEVDDEQDTLIGGGGFDVSLGDSADDTDDVERATNTVLAFLNAIG